MNIKPKDSYIVCFEGEAEQNLFGFLKLKFDKSGKHYKPIMMNGFNSFKTFQRKFRKIITGNSLGGKLKGKIHFIFFIDKDLPDSKKIEKLIKDAGHTVQFCDPNIEAVLLKVSGVNLVQDRNLEDFRKKCKSKFKEKFEKDAHEMLDVDLNKLIKNEEIFSTNFQALASLFS